MLFIYLYWTIILKFRVREVPEDGDKFLSDECTISGYFIGENISSSDIFVTII